MAISGDLFPCLTFLNYPKNQLMAINGDLFLCLTFLNYPKNQKFLQLQKFGTRQTDTHGLKKCFLGSADFFSKIGDSFRFHAVRRYASRALATGKLSYEDNSY
jgi:hypothetical protein